MSPAAADTLFGLGHSLLIRDVATCPFEACAADDRVDAVFTKWPDFDYVPVRRNGEIIGVVTRGDDFVVGTRARDVVRPLTDALLVSGDAPLLSLLEQLSKDAVRLVVVDFGVNGIVTRSDLHKPAVRALVFGLITHLETMMRNLILARLGGSKGNWLGFLSEERGKKMDEEMDRLRKLREDPPAIDLTGFCDKRDILITAKIVGHSYEASFKEAEKLRNVIAHSGAFADSIEDSQRFLKRVEVVRRLIRVLDGSQSVARE